MVELLVSKGADVDPEFGNHLDEHYLLSSPLIQAVSTGSPLMFSLLLRSGARGNSKIGGGTVRRLPGSPLQIATFRGHIEIARMLISGGAELNLTRGIHQCSLYAGPLHAAVYAGQIDMVELLLQSGADPNI